MIDWLFDKPWRFFSFMALMVVILLAPLFYYGNEADKARAAWCREHGYKVAGVSE